MQNKRRPHGELKAFMREYLRERQAPISEIRVAAEEKLGPVPQSSVRSALQDERYFQRVSRGVFRLQP